MSLEDAQEGKRYKVTWNDCCAKGNFTATLLLKTYVPDPPEPELFFESATFDNGVILKSPWYGYTAEEVTTR